MDFIIHDEQWASDLQRSIDEHMNSLLDQMWENEGGDILTDWGTIFCGCEVCYWREALSHLLPRIVTAYKEGKIDA